MFKEDSGTVQVEIAQIPQRRRRRSAAGSTLPAVAEEEEVVQSRHFTPLPGFAHPETAANFVLASKDDSGATDHEIGIRGLTRSTRTGFDPENRDGVMVWFSKISWDRG